jgi:hypothetical protein
MAEIIVDKKWADALIKKGMSKRLCVDCGGFDVGYGVWPAIWITAIREEPVVHTKNRICINCLQKRLGRNLVIDDFLPGSNELILFGYQLHAEEKRNNG